MTEDRSDLLRKGLVRVIMIMVVPCVGNVIRKDLSQTSDIQGDHERHQSRYGYPSHDHGHTAPECKIR